jgi:hypothetical protein
MDIREQLALLLRLQELHRRREEAASELAALPRRREQARREFDAFEAELKEFSAHVEVLRRQIRSLETDIESCKDQQNRYQSQLLEVKTNEAYRALLHEIEASKTKVQGIEDMILEKMVEEETLRSRAAEKKKQEPELRGRFEETVAGSEAEEKRLAVLRETLHAEWENERAGLDAGLRERFDRLLKSRGGTALARIEGELCTGCDIDVRPQLVQEVRSARALLQCENCQRILYWKDEEPPEGAPA